MKKFGKDYRNSQRNHLSLRAKLADEVAKGLYPSLTKDLIYIKACQEGVRMLPGDASLMNRQISKLDALKVLMKLDRDYWELFVVFDMIPECYAKIIS